MPDTTDPAASALDGIRERAGAAAAMDVDVLSAFNGVSVGGVIAASAVDVPRLLAAVEAALKMADEWDAESDRLDDLADKPGTDEEARPVLSGEAQGYSDCAGALREAITAALAGKEAGNASHR